LSLRTFFINTYTYLNSMAHFSISVTHGILIVL
jgi:hypothetical protein